MLYLEFYELWNAKVLQNSYHHSDFGEEVRPKHPFAIHRYESSLIKSWIIWGGEWKLPYHHVEEGMGVMAGHD